MQVWLHNEGMKNMWAALEESMPRRMEEVISAKYFALRKRFFSLLKNKTFSGNRAKMVELSEVVVGAATDCSGRDRLLGAAPSIGFDLRPVDTFPPSGKQLALQNAKSQDSKDFLRRGI
ncbi:hypothetical protein TNCV_589591 [Trichonephila clavipes]|nr:hypothetical protein TNCV_589591 [Trichonephila clavipes]